MTTIYKFKAAFTKAGVGTAPSSAPLCTVVDSADNVLANAQACTALANMTGVYLYSYSGADGLDLVALFHTTDATMDQQDLYSYTPDILTTNLNAPVGDLPTNTELTAALTADEPLGAGAIAFVVTITVGGSPVAGVTVWVSTDAAGTNVVASGTTDALGVVTFQLDAATYYVWKQLAGYNFTNPETAVVA